MIIKKPFVNYNLGEKKQDIISIKLNKEDREKLETIKRYIQQPKDSTIYKQCLNLIYSKVILGNFDKEILQTLTNNIRKNQRIGIIDFDDQVYK